MRQSFILILLFLSQPLFSQYKIDSTVKIPYLKVLEKLPAEFKNEIATEYEGGLSFLYSDKTDTLNKKDFRGNFNAIKIYDIDSETGKADSTESAPNEKGQISKNQPFPLSCSCSLRNDTLTIISGYYLFSGFRLTTTLYKKTVNALYTEVESEGRVLQRTLKEKKANEITIPATVSFITLNRMPYNNIKELFGQISVVTKGYYSYVNVWGFETDYIYKRKKIQFYFRCDIKNSIQQ